MKTTIRIIAAIATFAFILSSISFTTAEIENRPIEGAWKLTDIEVIHNIGSITMTVNKKSITEQYDIIISFKSGRYTLRLQEKNGNQANYYGTYSTTPETLSVHAEEDYAFPYYTIGNALTIINDNQTYTFIREDTSKVNAFKGGVITGSWKLTGFESATEANDQAKVADNGLFGAVLLASGLFSCDIIFDFRGETMTIQAGILNQFWNEIKGSYWTAGTMIHYSLEEIDEFFCYSVEDDTLRIGNNLYSLLFTRYNSKA